MRQIVLLVVVLLLSACGGSGKSDQNKTLGEVKWEENDLCAVLFIGYSKDFSALAETEGFRAFCEQFPSLQKMTKFTVETEGDEVYYIIPRHRGASVIVHEYKFDIENMEEIVGKELYRGGAEPVLIRCNFSDIHPNTFITVTENDKSVTFNPMSSMGEREGVQFVFLNETDPNVSAPLLPAECEYAGIRATIENGKVFLHFDLDKLQVADFYEVPYPIENRPYLVEGMSGACKGVLIGDVGQDAYPVLACLLEDGGLEIMDIYKAICDYDFRSSGRLREFENVITVVNEVVSYSDEGGGYIALFAVIAEGNKIEINLNPINGAWVYQVEGEHGMERYILTLTKDWKIAFISGYADSEAIETYAGTCRMIRENYDNDKIFVEYEYEMKEVDRFEMTGKAPDPTIRTGRFKMQQIEEILSKGMGITCVEGLMFHPEKRGKEVIFKMRRPE